MGRPEDLFQRLTEHGEEAIDELIADRQSEELFLDFKRSADNGAGKKLHEDDRKNLAKAISGFGNSEGGVVVWGVDCRPDQVVGDVASSKVPIDNPKRFKSWIEGAVSGCTVPPHPMVRHHAIESSSGRGFVATYIAKSYYAPHQCLKPSLQYYIRAGSDFAPTPHAVLSGLFGRRPQPSVFPMWSIVEPSRVEAEGEVGVDCGLGIFLGSHGPGIARELYVNVTFITPRGRTRGWMNPDQTNWSCNNAYGPVRQLVSNDSLKLAPQAMTEAINLKVIFVPPFEGNLYCKIVFGHEGSPTQVIEKTVAKEVIQSTYEKFMRLWDQDKERARKLGSDFFGIEEASRDSGTDS